MTQNVVLRLNAIFKSAYEFFLVFTATFGIVGELEFIFHLVH